MVHVMSEVKRVNIDFSGLQGPAKCGQCGSTTTDLCNENGCGFLESGNGEPELAAQRLRADTAEAYAKAVSKSFDDLAAIVGYSTERLGQTGESPMDCAEQIVAKLAAAEQRIAELVDLLTDAYGAIDENDGWKQLCTRILAVIQPTESGAIAAINPNPEAESHE